MKRIKMWKIIKHELSYYKTAILIIYVIIAPFLMINCIRGDFEKPLISVMITLLPIMGIVMNNEEKKSHKNSLYIRLPIPLRRIAFMRHGTWLLFWISLIILFGISLLIGSRDTMPVDIIWLCLTLFSAMTIFVAVFSILQDIKFFVKRHFMMKTVSML